MNNNGESIESQEEKSPEILEILVNSNSEALPIKSREKYNGVYITFNKWRESKNIVKVTESVLFEYFEELSKNAKPPTLWSQYSMLKNTLQAYDNIDIGHYTGVTSFLKTQSDGYVPKKSKVLSPSDIEKFLYEAPDKKYLATKVALVFGICGALRRDELTNIRTEDVKHHGQIIVVKIPYTNTKVPKSFLIDEEFAKIVTKYENLRPSNCFTDRFFLNYQSGKCTNQVIGKNKFGKMAKEIAHFLKLPEPDLYTGHSFRRTSATLLADSGADMTDVKRHGRWNTTSVVNDYIKYSYNTKKYNQQMVSSFGDIPSTSTAYDPLGEEFSKRIKTEHVTSDYENNPEDDMDEDQYSNHAILQNLASESYEESDQDPLSSYIPNSAVLIDRRRGPSRKAKEPCLILPDEDEMNLVQWILNSESAGFPITKAQLFDSVQKIIRDKNLDVHFADDRQKRWYDSFVKRHPELLEQHLLNTSPLRSQILESNIKDWFHNVYNYLEGMNMMDVLKANNRVFVCEESMFFLNHEDNFKIILKRCEQSEYSNDDRDRMTAVLLANAAGTLAPPMIVSRSQRLSKLMKDSVPTGWEVARSENGLSTSENFLDYIVKVFYPWLMSERITLPIILFLDASASPITYSLSEFCQKYGIILVALYSPNNCVSRPLDVLIHQSLEEEWKDVVINGSKTGRGIKREDFCPMFKEILERIDSRLLISSGFTSCGLYPFNVEKKHFVSMPRFEDQTKEVNDTKKDEKLSLLRGLEELIGEDKVTLFESCNEKWDGKVEDTSLFELWLRLKKDCGDDMDKIAFVKVELNQDCENYDGYLSDDVIDDDKSESN